MIGTPKFRITRGPYGLETEIRFAFISNDGMEVALPVQMQHVGENEVPPDAPMMRFSDVCSESNTALTSLMDELWSIGIRPSDIGTSGHLAATQRHLADMRAIVSKQVGVSLP